MAKGLKEALLEIQRSAPKVNKDGFNPHTKSHFMQLDDVLDLVLPLLSEQEILYQTFPCADEQGRPALEYIFTHLPTGETVTHVMPLMLPKGTPQDQGSAITYARRYAVVAALNLVADRDDDGHGATEAARQAGARLPATQTTTAAAGPSAEEQDTMRQAVLDLSAELKKDHPEAWAQTVEWAKQRSIDLQSPAADKLRALERALRRKLELAEAAKEQAVKPSEAATQASPGPKPAGRDPRKDEKVP